MGSMSIFNLGPRINLEDLRLKEPPSICYVDYSINEFYCLLVLLIVYVYNEYMVTIRDPVVIRIIQGLDSGNTTAVTLPKTWMQQFRIKKGDLVKLTKRDNSILLEKLDL